MAVYKRGGTYWYDFRFNGIRYQATCKTRNAIAARKIEAKAKTDLALGQYGLVSLKAAPTFEAFAKDFKAHIQVHLSEHAATVSFYEEKLTRLLEYKPIADSRLNQIDEEVLDKYVAHRRLTMAPGSVNKELATLRKALRYAWKKLKLINTVPVFPKLAGEGEREFVLTQDQEKAYLSAAADTLRDFAVLSLDTGVRCGEGVSLEWSNVTIAPIGDARLGSIYVTKGKSKNAKRTLSITPRVKAMLQKRQKFYPGERWVFPSGRKEDSHILVSSLDHQHGKARDACLTDDKKPLFTREFVIHSLRHTFGTRMGETGANAFEIMKLMGHSNVNVSQKYVHPTPDSMERAFERLDSMNRLLRGEKKAVEALGVPTDSTTTTKERK